MFSFEKKIPKVYLGIPSHVLFGSCLSRTEERAYPSRFGVPKTTNMVNGFMMSYFQIYEQLSCLIRTRAEHRSLGCRPWLHLRGGGDTHTYSILITTEADIQRCELWLGN